tara:strand:+ start:99 stop:221 length:123 start_codon:yes stop_codon:yes gene_type:complete
MDNSEFKDLLKNLSARIVGVAAALGLYFGVTYYLMLQGYL